MWRIDREAFALAAHDAQRRLGGRWQWRSVGDGTFGYLMIDGVRHWLPRERVELPPDEADDEVLSDVDDPAELVVDANDDDSDRKHSDEWVFEYHVVWSPVYSVPAMYFNCRRQDTGAPGRLDAVESVVRKSAKARIADQGVFPSLLQEDHPLLGVPFFCVHPCNTAELMDVVLADTTSPPPNVLISWLSLVGAYVGVHVPLSALS